MLIYMLITGDYLLRLSLEEMLLNKLKGCESLNLSNLIEKKIKII